MESNKNNEIPPQGLFNSQKEENMDFFLSMNVMV